MSFEKPHRIRFADCDPAGMVFYPRYFEMINGTIEDWFDDGLGYGFQQMIVEDGFGVPAAHIDVDFKAASRLDDQLVFALTVIDVGRSSIKLTISARCGEETRLIAQMVLVYINSAKHAPARLPDALKAKMLEFREIAA
jgi:4-hydroxybenzoyl-CoA thioesterase